MESPLLENIGNSESEYALLVNVQVTYTSRSPSSGGKLTDGDRGV